MPPKMAQQAAAGNGTQPAIPRLPPTPQMAAIGTEVQGLTQQIQQLGGASSTNPAAREKLMRIQQLRQQYGVLAQQQFQAYRTMQHQASAQGQQASQQQQAAAAMIQQQQQQQQQQAHQRAVQQQQQATAQQAAQGRTGQNSSPAGQTGALNQVHAIFGAAPPANASPQVQAQWQEQQTRVQNLLKLMSELKTKIQGLKQELNNPHMSPELKAQKSNEMGDSIKKFQNLQTILQQAGRQVRQAGAAAAPGTAQTVQQGAQQTTGGTPAQSGKGTPRAQAAQMQAQTSSSSKPGTPQPAAGGAATPGGATSSGQHGGGTSSPIPVQRQNSGSLGAGAAPSTPSVPVAVPVVPQTVPPGRPTLSNGYTGPSSISSPALARPPVSSTALPLDPNARMLGKRKLSALLGTIDPLEKLDPDVEDVLLDVADEFIESVVGFACKLAKHRKSDVLKMEDIKVVLEKEWNIRAMGFADERTETRKKLPKEGTKEYRGKLAAVQTAKSLQ